MIAKTDILARAKEWGLRAEVVEKDYVLGWLLAGFASHPVTSLHWVFKGGTCLKKCYLETFRFSEDLDFSLLPEGAYSDSELRILVAEVTEIAAAESGLAFPTDGLAIAPGRDKLGRQTFVGRVTYRGPLAVPTGPKITLDITQQEPVLAAVQRQSMPTRMQYPKASPFLATRSRSSSPRSVEPCSSEPAPEISTTSSILEKPVEIKSTSSKPASCFGRNAITRD
jgi:hypothetical protein